MRSRVYTLGNTLGGYVRAGEIDRAEPGSGAACGQKRAGGISMHEGTGLLVLAVPGFSKCCQLHHLQAPKDSVSSVPS